MSVYFITIRDLNLCKIGIARNVRARHSSLQTASPHKLVVEATLEGSRELERELHVRFAEHKVSGEWFTITESLETLIAEAASSAAAESRPDPTPPTRAEETRLAEHERVERDIALHRRLLAEGMLDLERAGSAPKAWQVEPTLRQFEPVAYSGGQHARHFAVRDTQSRKIYCGYLHLTWEQADHLCDTFAELTRQRERAAA